MTMVHRGLMLFVIYMLASAYRGGTFEPRWKAAVFRFENKQPTIFSYNWFWIFIRQRRFQGYDIIQRSTITRLEQSLRPTTKGSTVPNALLRKIWSLFSMNQFGRRQSRSVQTRPDIRSSRLRRSRSSTSLDPAAAINELDSDLVRRRVRSNPSDLRPSMRPRGRTRRRSARAFALAVSGARSLRTPASVHLREAPTFLDILPSGSGSIIMDP